MKYIYKNKEIFPVVEIYHDVFPYLSNIGMKDFYMDKEKCAYVWKKGASILKEYFGDLIPIRKPSPPPLSYGHLISIGAPCNIPDDGEPNISAFASSIEEAIDILKERKGKDFTDNKMFQHYLDVWNYLKNIFPEQNMPFNGFNHQGPLTSAALMRGIDFYYDIYDKPEETKIFIELLTDSIIDYIKLIRKINNQNEIQEKGYIADDFASLISPDQWDDFVIPYWNQYYNALCNGKERFVHVENLVPTHLKYLKNAGITHYQPSVSEKITLENIKANLDPGISFDWLLYAYHITEMTNEEIQKWVDITVQAGVSIIRTQFGSYAHQVNKLDKIAFFIKAFDKYKDGE